MKYSPSFEGRFFISLEEAMRVFPFFLPKPIDSRTARCYNRLKHMNNRSYEKMNSRENPTGRTEAP